jgi:hypothetical protein
MGCVAFIGIDQTIQSNHMGHLWHVRFEFPKIALGVFVLCVWFETNTPAFHTFNTNGVAPRAMI